jgi:hypothetical protein
MLAFSTARAGGNPFNALAFAVDGDRLSFRAYRTTGWEPARDLGPMALNDVLQRWHDDQSHAKLPFPIYDYVAGNGYENLSRWIDGAAAAAGR